MDTQTVQHDASPPTRAPRHGLLPALVGVGLLLGVLVRLGTRSALWLDEALSVNIAALPLDQLPAALRQDGAPPLYYLLLHTWTAVLGTGDVAARSLSQLCALLALPLAWLVATRLHSTAAGWTAALLLASNPFAVQYANEARMYALVVLLVLAGVLALHAALRDPRPLRLLPVALLSGALALTHYWALFLLAVTGLGLLLAARNGPARAPLRTAAALAAGGVLFLPWLPTFLFQMAHTGTPWARSPGLDAVLDTWRGWGGGRGLPAAALGLLLLALALGAAVARPWRGDDGREGVLLRLPVRGPGAVLAGAAVGTLTLGVAAAALQSSGYALRYSSVAFAPALLAAALGAQALPQRARTVVVGLAVVLGLASALPQPFSTRKTQAALTASVLRERLQPGDLVVYCPDQLGPAVDRLLPGGTAQVVYPTGAAPVLVDWVDYAERNAAGDPEAFAAEVGARTTGAVWLVRADGYRTFGNACARLGEALAQRRGAGQVVLLPQRRFDERSRLVRYP